MRSDVLEAYRSGVAEGERRTQAAVRVHAEAAYREGYAAGLLEAAAQAGPTRSRSAPLKNRGEALALLELPADATASQIKERARALRGALHPDALRNRGYPATFVEYGAELFKAVGVASDLLAAATPPPFDHRAGPGRP